MSQAELILLSLPSGCSAWAADGHVTPAEPINVLPWEVATGGESCCWGVGTQRLPMGGWLQPVPHSLEGDHVQ